mgnify:CR=1 FL=1
MREYASVTLPEPRKVIRIGDIPPFDVEDYDLSNPKRLTGFFFAVERLVRTSWAYRRLTDFLRQWSDMRKCAFYENVNSIDTTGIHIHLHHAPFTLFDIVSVVYQRRLACHEPVDEEDVAQEVIWNHYRMVCGLIPLSETVHELVHNGFLFIPTSAPFGYYRKFVVDYEPFIDRELMRVLTRNEEASMEYDMAKETKVLTFQSVYLDPTGAWSFPRMEDVIALLKKKVDEHDAALAYHQQQALGATGGEQNGST